MGDHGVAHFLLQKQACETFLSCLGPQSAVDSPMVLAKKRLGTTGIKNNQVLKKTKIKVPLDRNFRCMVGPEIVLKKAIWSFQLK